MKKRIKERSPIEEQRSETISPIKNVEQNQIQQAFKRKRYIPKNYAITLTPKRLEKKLG